MDFFLRRGSQSLAMMMRRKKKGWICSTQATWCSHFAYRESYTESYMESAPPPCPTCRQLRPDEHVNKAMRKSSCEACNKGKRYQAHFAGSEATRA